MTAPSTTLSAPAAESAPYDRERLLARLGGNTQILAEVAALFCTESARMLQDIEHYLENQDSRARAAAHQLKGVLLNVSADTAAMTARELESRLRAEQWAEGKALSHQLGAQLRELVEAFSREAGSR